ncbi:uncharacterized protein LOC120651839 [Panicum virgatum]|uniref:uncharacterized protein LOC120651839 n=1 Tax=Panicum virgatum TaxID=38727 RepID=UPI0019D601FF|nr:uncharacterized protein LOC120651839 [Panicum virgatum]
MKLQLELQTAFIRATEPVKQGFSRLHSRPTSTPSTCPSTSNYLQRFCHSPFSRLRSPSGWPAWAVASGGGRFYGSSLPRLRFFPGDRVDPLPSVTEPLLAWAQEAHWSMGGLGVKRLRLQGRIEGSPRRSPRSDDGASDGDSDEEEAVVQERILKREVVDDDEDSDRSDQSEEEEDDESLATIATASKRKRARKLSDEFDRIAAQQELEKKQKAAAGARAAAGAVGGGGRRPALREPSDAGVAGGGGWPRGSPSSGRCGRGGSRERRWLEQGSKEMAGGAGCELRRRAGDSRWQKLLRAMGMDEADGSG